jgi:hypothetical protein
VKWFTAIIAIDGYCRQKILEERPMRGNMAAGPAYVALILAAAAVLLSAPNRNGGLYSETQRLLLTDIAPKADAIAGAIAENPSVMIPP